MTLDEMVFFIEIGMLPLPVAPAQDHMRPDRTLQVQYRPLEALIPYARNARTHSEAQVAQIAASIREFAFTRSMVASGLPLPAACRGAT